MDLKEIKRGNEEIGDYILQDSGLPKEGRVKREVELFMKKD